MSARITVDITDPAMAAHFAHAVALHTAWARKDRLDVPQRLIDAALDAKKWATVVRSGPLLSADDDTGDDAPMLLSLPEVAQLLGRSVSTVKRLIAAQALPTVTVGSTRSVRRGDLEAYVGGLGSDNDQVSTIRAREGT